MLMQYVRSRWPMVMCGPNGQLSQYDEDRPSPSCHLRSHTSVHPTMNLSLNPMPHIISSSKCLQCNTLFCTARPPPRHPACCGQLLHAPRSSVWSQSIDNLAIGPSSARKKFSTIAFILLLTVSRSSFDLTTTIDTIKIY